MVDVVQASNEFFQAYNERDMDAVEAKLSPTLEFTHFNRGFSASREELMGLLRAYVDGIMPDRKFSDPANVVASGKTVIREATFSGTAQTDIPGMGNAGDVVELELCSVMTFDDDGIIVEWKDYG